MTSTAKIYVAGHRGMVGSAIVRTLQQQAQTNIVTRMSTTNRLYEAIKDFPDPVLAEIVDFAEFLRDKRINIRHSTSDEPLSKLAGGLEGFENFAGDPLAVQVRMRDEWH